MKKAICQDAADFVLECVTEMLTVSMANSGAIIVNDRIFPNTKAVVTFTLDKHNTIKVRLVQEDASFTEHIYNSKFKALTAVLAYFS